MARGFRLLTASALVLAALGCRPAPESARDRALEYLESVGTADASWSYLGPHLGRRFGLELPLADGRALGATDWSQDADVPTLAPFRRLFDPQASTRRDDIRALESPSDQMLAVALHCDRLGVPEDWRAALERATDVGGYAATHAALALSWSLENGCIHWVDATALRHRQVGVLVSIVENVDALESDDPNAADVWVEALALLYYGDARSRVQPEWLDRLLRLQRPDGGWPEHPRAPESSAHTTAFALWVLSEETLSPKGSAAMIPRDHVPN